MRDPHKAPQVQPPERMQRDLEAHLSPWNARSRKLVTLLIIGAVAIAGYRLLPFGNGEPVPTNQAADRTAPAAQKPTGPTDSAEAAELPPGVMAAWPDIDLAYEYGARGYPIPVELDRVTNLDSYELSEAALDSIKGRTMVVVPAKHKEFHTLYEQNRYGKVPNLITVDSVLHSYHLIFNKLLEDLEAEKLAELAESLSKEMVQISARQLDGLKGSEWENAARRNLAFFSVAARLSDSGFRVDSRAWPAVEAELKLIDEKAGLKVSPVMMLGIDPDTIDEPYIEDYSQYQPRGHYDQTPELRNYFRTMMWYGRMTFRFGQEDEVRSAALVAIALEDQERLSKWDAVYGPTAFFVGESDDISQPDMAKAVQSVYGSAPAAADLMGDDDFLTLLDELDKLPPPSINSMVVWEEGIQPDREKAIKGFRFMGQRYVLDADIFQRLIYREVGANPDGQNRMLPSGLDIPAAFGSETAAGLLKKAGAFRYDKYESQLAKTQAAVSELDEGLWQSNLYFGWLYALKGLFSDSAQRPNYLSLPAWEIKRVNSFLGSWTELKHDTILYAKQVYAELGGGGAGEEDDWYKGFVEPEPVVYARLQALTKMTSEGLKTRGLLSREQEKTLGLMDSLLDRLRLISIRILSGEEPTEAQYAFIRSYGGQLEHLWMQINAQAGDGYGTGDFLNNNPASLVADVATDPNGQVLEVANGDIWEIYAVVPIGDEERLVRGGVYSYREFPWPLNDRLTDDAWRSMLEKDKASEPPDWYRRNLMGTGDRSSAYGATPAGQQ